MDDDVGSEEKTEPLLQDYREEEDVPLEEKEMKPIKRIIIAELAITIVVLVAIIITLTISLILATVKNNKLQEE